MDNISTAILAISLIIIMFGMGLSLVFNDFKRILISPKAILTGLVNQIVLLPLVGFILIKVFTLPPEIAIGVIILAACPGGPTSNLITHLAKGDTALSVSLTAISSFITLLTIPFVINLGLNTVLGENTPIKLDVLQTIAQVFVIVIIPVVLGMLVRAKKEAFANRMEKPVRIASAIVFVLVLVGILLKERANIVPYFQQAGIVALLLNVVTMLLGFLAARIMKLSFRQGISISIESGIQNGTLAIAIATVLLNNTSYAIAPAVYSLIMFLTGGAVIFWSLRRGTHLDTQDTSSS
jgi:BASS family bile acid:Na+ symporter